MHNFSMESDPKRDAFGISSPSLGGQGTDPVKGKGGSSTRTRGRGNREKMPSNALVGRIFGGRGREPGGESLACILGARLGPGHRGVGPTRRKKGACIVVAAVVGGT